jgi:hypothetical protein
LINSLYPSTVEAVCPVDLVTPLRRSCRHDKKNPED